MVLQNREHILKLSEGSAEAPQTNSAKLFSQVAHAYDDTGCQHAPLEKVISSHCLPISRVGISLPEGRGEPSWPW